MLKKYREAVAYLLVGGFSTILAWAVWFVLAYSIFDVQVVWQNLMLSVVSWLICDGVVYFMNRVFVFQSKARNIGREFLSFSAGRLLTLLLDSGMMIFLVNVCRVDKVVSKIVSSAMVMVVNYLISKLWVFQRK